MSDPGYARDYGEKIVYSAGMKHGTPGWNPAPHPDADPGVVAARDLDPLWQYHRSLRLYDGRPVNTVPSYTFFDNPNNHQVVLRSQVVLDDPPQPGSMTAERHGFDVPDHRNAVPVGLVPYDPARRQSDSPDVVLNRRDGTGGGAFSPMLLRNQGRYDNLFGHGGGRRPWWNAVFPLQDLTTYSAPHDPYGLLAGAVISGNRHALPPLVDLLKRRDNPAGWSPVWTALAKAMADRTGDLPAHEVARRVDAVAEATAAHSNDPDGHRRLHATVRPDPAGWTTEEIDNNPVTGQRTVRVIGPDGSWRSQRHGFRGTDADAIREAVASGHDFTGYAALADHMAENNLEPYAQLVRAELANVLPHFRWTPSRKGRRL